MDSDIMEWTKEELEHLVELSDISQLKTEEITYLLNDKHKNARTVAVVEQKLRVGEVVLVETPKKEMKKGWAFVSTPNSRKSWVTADDKYLLENWTANTETRLKVAEHLGRSIASCSTRTSVLKHRPELKEYYLTLIAGGLTPEHRTTFNEAFSVETEAKVITSELSHLLVGITPDDYTTLDRIYHWLKTRQARKLMASRDREQVKVKKMKLQKKIDSLEKELKTVGR